MDVCKIIMIVSSFIFDAPPPPSQVHRRMFNDDNEPMSVHYLPDDITTCVTRQSRIQYLIFRILNKSKIS